jgi:hypothetical protein
MIKIENHPNLANWINVFCLGELVEQVTCHAKALRFAQKLASKKRLPLVDVCTGEITTNG